MKHALLATILFAALLGPGCKRRAPEPASAPTPAPSSAVARVSVLFFEDGGDLAPGGLSLYADQIEGLARALRERGLEAQVVGVPADDSMPALPRSTDVAVVVDTPLMRETERRLLDGFMAAGGVVLQVGPADAAEPTARSGLAKRAAPANTWAASLPAELDFGPLAVQRWPAAASGASVLLEDGDGAPVLTEAARGAGRLLHLAVLPSGRHFQGWNASPGGVALIEQVVRSAPARGAADDAPPLRVDVVSGGSAWPVQAGAPRIVVRVRGGGDAPSGAYVVRDAAQREVARGALTAGPARWRSAFLVAELADLGPGTYEVEVRVPPHDPVNVAVSLDANVFASTVEPALHAWLDGLAWPEPTVDANGLAVVEERALLVWSLARALEAPSAHERYRFDLERAAMWLRAAGPGLLTMPGRPAPELAAYAAGAARALGPIRDSISRSLAAELQSLAEQVYSRVAAQANDELPELGGRLWAAAELYRATRIETYRDDAGQLARQLFARQLDRDRVVEGDVQGDFFHDAARTTFAPGQWARDRRVGVYLGLIALERALDPGPLKTDLGVALDRFTRGYLLAGGALHPFGAFPVALDPAAPPRPRADGRGLEAPEHFRLLHYSRAASGGDRGVTGIRLALAVVASERAQATGEAALREAAARQLCEGLGHNPAARALWTDAGALNGLIGRGADNVPVWREGISDQPADATAYLWLPALRGLLSAPPP
jgi:hypothetical protein